MTLWQDPPPQTRRQARESERAAAQQKVEGASRARRAGTASTTTAGDIPDVSTSSDSKPAEVPPLTSDSASSGERPEAMEPVPASVDATPIARPVPPRYDGVSFDNLLQPPPIPATDETPATETADAEPAGADLFQSPPSAGGSEPLTSPLAVVPSGSEGSATESAVPTSAVPAERMLTRRQLRAMQQAQEAGATETVAQAPQPEAESSTESSEAERETPAGSNAERPAPAAQAVPAAPLRIDSIATPGAEPITARPFADILAPSAEPSAQQAGEQPTTVVYETPQDADALSSRAYVPPTGHWSIAAQEPDDDSDGTAADAAGYARSRVSSGTVTTTNALILPMVPSVADATGPLTSTGEILVTGSIDLPRSLGATGTHSDRFDSSDIDHMFEPGESSETNSDAIPIRASRAVSSHTSTRDVITPRKHRSNKLPTVLAVTAAVLALGVVALLVVGYVFKVF